MSKTEKKEFVSIGKIIESHGVKGFAKVYPLTDFIERFDELEHVYFFKEDKLMFETKVEQVRYTANNILVKFEKFSTPEEINLYKGYFLKINKDDLFELPEDIFYLDDLRGMEAYSTENIYLGKVVEVYNNVNDILEIKTPDKKEVMVPFVKEIVTDVDMKNRKITINTIPGLFDDNFETDKEG